MTDSPEDQRFMEQALQLAQQSLYHTAPNPRVGCVIVKQGKVIGTGQTQPAGQNHAEIQAIQMASSHALQGSTAYVTLEPCSHHGRTPPCVDALIESGIQKVFISMLDPNPLVNGQGVQRLQQAGISVHVGLKAEQAKELNLGFISRMQRGLPWVRLKMASSLDGKIALSNGSSQWITSQAARADGHHWRARACAILTGIGTILSDDPQLNVREIDTQRQPLRIILDRQLRIPLHAKILQQGKVMIICENDQAEHQEKALQLKAQGVQVVAFAPARSNTIWLKQVLTFLAKQEINELHIEAGQQLSGAFIQAHLVDELLFYLAPKLLSAHALNMLDFPEPNLLAESPHFTFQSAQSIGDDLRIIARSTVPPPL